MFTFSKPRYLSKRVHPVTQRTEPSYQFDVQYHGSMTDAPISLLLEADTTLTVSHLDEVLRDEKEWWLSFLQSFLTASASYFSRPYTAHHLQRILRHLLDNYPASSAPSVPSALSTSLPQRVCCVPRVLELIGGQLLVHWAHEAYPAGIHIPDEDMPLSLPVSAEMEEWDANAVPEEQATGILEDPTMLLEKQRVKETRLRAKLAVYRAQYQMTRFQNKYGQEVSDSESEEEAEEDEEVDSFS
jgi:hypothetical protein